MSLSLIPETPLDYALLAARSDPDACDPYYTVFLNTDVYVPTAEIPREVSERVTQDVETYRFVVIEHGGGCYLPVFDTYERLEQWTQRQVGVIRLSAAALVSSLQPDVHLLLNPRTSFAKEFVLEELAWLRDSLRITEPQEQIVAEDTSLLISVPAVFPDGLEDALRLYLVKRRSVRAAYLAQAQWPEKQERPHYVLLVEMDETKAEEFPFVARHISPALRGVLAPEEMIDIVLLRPEDDWSAVTDQVSPFYQRRI